MTFLEIQVDLDPNLFTIGPFTLTWHGVFSVLGILAAIRMTQWLAWRHDRIESDKVYDAAFWAVVVGLLGARILYVAENYRLFEGARWVHVLYVNEGGISQWGGIFGAMLGLWFWTYRNRVSFWKLLDAVGLPALVGLAIGRIGDVINGEHHGTPTGVPWGVRYVNAHTLGQPGLVVHPEVAYEMILCLGLVLLFLPFLGRIRSRLPDGVSGLWFLGLYAIGRFYLSYFRDDQIEFGLRQAQWASLLMVVMAIGFSAYLLRRRAVATPVVVLPASDGGTHTPPAPTEPRRRAAHTTDPAPARRSRAAGGSSGTPRQPPPAASPPDR
jgi:phosphatidylglycerol:prolipoprotein diacylglycerol transferase